jgi:hypothetical protein
MISDFNPSVSGHTTEYFNVTFRPFQGVSDYPLMLSIINASDQADQVVAISGDDKVLPPCGCCRELMYEIDPSNLTITRESCRKKRLSF